MTPTTSIANNFDPGISGTTYAFMDSEQVSRRAFVGVAASLFIISATVTALWCSSMSPVDGMPMPGGWTMSMTWMRMPGQTWINAMGSFVGMWVVMMVAMMLPSLTPMLWRYRQSLGSVRETHRGRLITLVGLGYFFVWTLFGFAVFAAGVAAAAIEMKQPALARDVPIAAGSVVLIAGALQFTRWKAHSLARCRETPGCDRVPSAHSVTAWRLGLLSGLHCGISCANLTAILLVFGIMDLRAMIAVTAAITAERLAPAGEHVARVVGAVAIATGLILIARAVRLG